jgi:MFS family permease
MNFDMVARVPTLRLLTPLRSRAFAQLVFGQFLSGIGDGAFLVAIVTVMVVQRQSATDLGVVLGTRSAVALVALLFGGVIADLARRTRIMAATDALRAVLVLLTAFTSPWAPLWVWVVFAALMGLASSAFQPAYQAAVPAFVPGEALEAGNALKVLSTRGALILGPSIGALLVSTGGVRLAFLVDAFTFMISLATLIGIKEPPHTTTAMRRNPLRAAGQGLRAVLDRPWIAWVIGSGTLQIMFVLAPVTIMIPLVLHSRQQDAIYGLVVGLRAAGSVLGTLFAAHWRPRRPGLAAMCGPLTMAVLIVFFVIPAPTWVILVAALISGTGPSLFIVYWPTALQRAIPEELRGRVFAFDQLGAYTLQPVGLVLAPLAVTALGFTAPTMIALAVLVVTTFVPLAIPGVTMFATPERRNEEVLATG